MRHAPLYGRAFAAQIGLNRIRGFRLNKFLPIWVIRTKLFQCRMFQARRACSSAG